MSGLQEPKPFKICNKNAQEDSVRLREHTHAMQCKARFRHNLARGCSALLVGTVQR